MDNLKTEKDQLVSLEKLYKEKNYEEFLSLSEKLIHEFPDSFQIKLLYGKVLIELNRLSEAEELLKELIQAFPDNINLLLELGNLYSKLNDYDKSFEYYNKILFLDPFNLRAKESIKKVNEIINITSEGNQTQETEENEVPDLKIEVEEREESEEKIIEGEDSDFVTESAAELYLSQGLFEEALKIYEQLYSLNKEEAFLLKINEVKKKRLNQKKIQLLSEFLNKIQKKGEKVV